MRIAVIGLGYVGLVGAMCLASMGHEIVGVDIDEGKINKLKNGELPIYEEGLEEYYKKAVEEGRVSFTTDVKEAVEKTELCFVCVGTPSRKDGTVNLSYVESAATEIGRALKDKDSFYTVCFRSTIPPGTSNSLIIPILERESGKKVGKDFGYAFNPEFLREGTAIYDFFNPPKTVVGAGDERSAEVILEVYKDIPGGKFKLPIVESEMVKYVDNVWHAIKVAFANEVGYFAKQHGADGRLVMKVFCEDRKLNISPYYLMPGFAFGGSCLPKDVKGFVSIANQKGIEVPLISSVMKSNESHIDKAVKLIKEQVEPGSTVAIIGVAFKPGTDDTRESPAVYLARKLLDEGYKVRYFDPLVDTERVYRHFDRDFISISDEDFYSSLEEAFKDTDYLVLTGSYRDVPQEEEAYREKYVFDLNGVLYDKPNLREACKYYALCW
ncbi:nucleotide sugar dehydrogenase [Phorcysia thermohydrogeniphila]|uniref:UDP-glucose 6-dehydrogenase n=1 Tax=Phorcysia thermohydrogeniphila TaxID=936138 RepID=A0A4R1GBA8_9BACT|nr:nucleotide sugar dehydrogenase [Phorcysia thermohydrogeniphila]TCK05274.1 GDP-mannose 6-dehydrogenase [Phorcysia thermohydrogeniphila]